MATFKLKFRPSTAEGKPGTLYFQVTHRRSTRTVYTDYHITPEEWDGRTSFIRIIGTPERQAELQLIASKVRWDCKGAGNGGIYGGRHRIGIPAAPALPNVVRLYPRHGGEKAPHRQAGYSQDLS